MQIKITEKKFGDKPIFANFNLTIAAGEFLAIAGPSGCGKTTLLRLIAGIDRDAQIVVTDPPARLGYVFQEPRLLPWRTVEENVELACQNLISSPSELSDTVKHSLQSVELWQDRTLYPEALSLGMKRRAELARALAIKPDLLILDEPFVSLDNKSASELRALLLRVWKEEAQKIIMVTHDLNEALQLADRMLTLSGQPARINQQLSLIMPHSARNPEWISEQLSTIESKR